MLLVFKPHFEKQAFRVQDLSRMVLSLRGCSVIYGDILHCHG